jgi:hypothetical protein
MTFIKDLYENRYEPDKLLILIEREYKKSTGLPEDVVKDFHDIVSKHRSSMWSTEQHVLDKVAAFISR